MYESTSESCCSTDGWVTVRRILTLLNSTWTSESPLTSQVVTVKAKETLHNRIWVLGLVLAQVKGLVWAFSTFRYKACDCNFFDQLEIYSSVCLCVCVYEWVLGCVNVCMWASVWVCVFVRAWWSEWADIDEGCLSSETYGTVCNPSSYSMIIKTIVLCDDRNRS